MELLSLIFAGALAILVDTAWVAIFRARPVGRFRVLRDNASAFTFASNHGTFTVNEISQTLSYAVAKQRGSLRLSEIKGIEYRVNEKYALLEEFFFGFDLTDFLSKYQDTVEWFSIAAVTTDGRRIPLYLSGRYCQREFLLGWYIELQTTVLSRIGLLKDAEEQSRSALGLLRARMGNARLL
jgi:hypothetical protein